MKLLTNKLALFFPSLLIALLLCCTEKDQETAHTPDKPAVVEKKVANTTEKPKLVEKKQEESDPNVVAKIGDYTITKEELEDRILKEIRPKPYDFRSEFEMPDAEEILLTMIAEKALVMEAYKQNLHEEETIRSVIKKFKEKKFVNALLAAHLKGKITVTNSEIEEQIKSNPKLDTVKARTMLIRKKSGELLNQYYNELYTKFNVQKLSENFFKTAQIHNRLLYQPKKPRKMNFIRISQTKEELTPEEKEIVLATYDYGKITLKDWFAELCEMSPPSRPKDLHTPKGVEQLLDRALKMPIFVSEAKLLGFDKDEDILKQARDYEDSMLLTKAKREKIKDIKGPIDEEQLVAYFNKNKELFGTQNTLNVDQIWCQDLKTAQKAKAELDSGKDFESVKQSYSLEKKSKPYDTFPGSEGMFFNDLWKGEPNQVVGPLKGFYGEGLKWRIVKILEKKPGIVQEYSADMNKNIEMKILERQRNTILEEYNKKLLEEYSYETYADRIRDIDPLDIP